MWKVPILTVLFGAYLAALLWITLFSRVGYNYRGFYQPFWSIIEIINGNRRVLIESVGNTALFIPFGVLCRRLFGLKRRHVIILGLCVSLLIECSQWLFRLGFFEIDDIVNNSIGAAVGALILTAGKNVISRKDMFALVIAFCVSLLIPFSYITLHYHHMEMLAANGDGDDGTKNLLVLDGKSGYVGDIDVYVGYLSDGSISISGISDKRSWKRLADLTLSLGTYSFSGLTGTEPDTIAIELEYYDEEQDSYIRFTPDVGPIDEARFALDRETKLRAYVGVYPGAKGDYVAFPVIYRED